jgi:putative hydrolase of the HAD superfamily
MNAYLFDLGNVLAGFEHRIFCNRLAGSEPSWGAEDIYRIVFQEGLNDRFETGRINGGAFYEELRKRMGLSLSLERFRDLWNDIFWENPGMEAILETLHPGARLVLVSNTNAWHLEHVRDRYSLLDHFDAMVLSYEIGVRKPDPRFFQAALDAAGTEPRRCLYFDDLEANVEAASRLGIPSVLFRFHPLPTLGIP